MVLGRQQPIGIDFPTDGTRGVQRHRFVPSTVSQRDIFRILERVFHFLAEPVIDAFRKQTAGKTNQQHRRDQREADEGGDQFIAEAGSQQPLPALEIGLDQVA